MSWVDFKYKIEFQEAIKQIYSSEGNCYRTKGKKDKEMIV